MKKVLLLTIAGVLLASPVYAAISVIPNAGSLQEELKQERHWVPRDKERQVGSGNSIPAGQVENSKITIKGIKVVGNEIYSQEEILKKAGYKGPGEMSFRDLQGLCNNISAVYQKDGMITAYAFMPVQEVTDGIVTIQVMTGHYGKVTIDNKSQVTNGTLESITRHVKEGKIIEKNSLDKALIMMNDLPGTKVTAILEPSKTAGAADVSLDAIETERSGGYVWIDNFGNATTGKNRIGANFHMNNLGNIGDLFSASYVTSNNDLKNWDFRYEAPFTRTGTIAGVAFTKMTYGLGDVFSDLGGYGDSKTWQLYMKTPLKRTMYNNLWFNVYYEDRELHDVIDKWFMETNKGSKVARFALQGDYRDATKASRYGITYSTGMLSMLSDDAKKYDIYGTHGHFDKAELDLYHIQKLSNKGQLHLALKGQLAANNLDSSEKLYIAGYNGVRAYPQGESGGDLGYQFTAEYRHTLGKQWQMAGYFDAGYVKYNKAPLIDYETSRTLSGVGLGVIWTNSDRNYARLDYAIPLSNKYSNQEGKDVHGQWWFQLVQRI